MWQAESFDLPTIERELKWANAIGLNSVRVYLHDLAYAQDPSGFLDRVDRFLSVAADCRIRPLFVIFDDCWLPDPVAGPQPSAVPGRHNSGWVQSPGRRAATDSGQRARLRDYVRALGRRFGDDDRILLWDVYNEVGNTFLGAMSWPAALKWPALAFKYIRFRASLPATVGLLGEAFGWLREVGVRQPLTAGLYLTHRRLNRVLVDLSDVISFHNYRPAGQLRAQITELERLNRPLFCTEYMARSAGSAIVDCLPVFFERRVHCFNWGLVAGKTQTIYDWTNRGSAPPTVWFHDLLHADGSPYDAREIEILRTLTMQSRSTPS